MVCTEGARGNGKRSARAPKFTCLLCICYSLRLYKLKKGVRKSSSDTTFTPSFMKICQLVQEFKWGYTNTAW